MESYGIQWNRIKSHGILSNPKSPVIFAGLFSKKFHPQNMMIDFSNGAVSESCDPEIDNIKSYMFIDWGVVYV